MEGKIAAILEIRVAALVVQNRLVAEQSFRTVGEDTVASLHPVIQPSLHSEFHGISHGWRTVICPHNHPREGRACPCTCTSLDPGDSRRRHSNPGVVCIEREHLIFLDVVSFDHYLIPAPSGRQSAKNHTVLMQAADQAKLSRFCYLKSHSHGTMPFLPGPGSPRPFESETLVAWPGGASSRQHAIIALD